MIFPMQVGVKVVPAPDRMNDGVLSANCGMLES